MLRGQNLSEDTGVKLIEDDFVYVSPELANKYKRSIVRKGDLVFTSWGTVGQVGLVDDSAHFDSYLLSNKQMKMTPDLEQVVPLYLYYYLSQPKMIWEVKARSIGSSVPGFNLGQLKKLPVLLPSLQEQRAIAEVLGALDDKITANNKLATAADDLARALFQKALKSATYSDESFADLAEVSGGGTPSTKKPEYWNGTIPWATPTDVTALSGPYLEETSRTISELGLKSCSSALYPAGTILMTSRATIGAFALAQVPTAVNQGFIVVQPNDPSLRFWLFHEMRSRVDEFISLANGATFLELSRGNFKKFKVRKATPETMAAFNETAGVLHDSARAALLENNSLVATRDALLPQLMSGKILVREAESIVEDVL